MKIANNINDPSSYTSLDRRDDPFAVISIQPHYVTSASSDSATNKKPAGTSVQIAIVAYLA
eukprot:7982540-Ditylum_brightwellii.AAC.1